MNPSINLNLTDISIPETEKDITGEWLAKATGLEPLLDTISITSNIQEGLGFLSNMFRVSFKTNSSSYSTSVIIKLSPPGLGYRAWKFDEREIQFYMNVAPKLLQLDPELGGNLCKIYCGNMISSEEKHASMIIMEDLKETGYEMHDPESQGWEGNLEKLVDFLTKFHVAGQVLEKKEDMKICKMFPVCMGFRPEADMDETSLKQNSEMWLKEVQRNFSSLDDFLSKGGVNDAVRNAYKNLAKFDDQLYTIIMTKVPKFASVIHGDLWAPNLMVSKDSSLPMKVLDWQFLGYQDISYDVTVAILTCIPLNEMQRSTVDKHCKLYYCKFLEYAKSNGLSGSEVQDETEFFEFFNTWGMTYAFLWFLLSFQAFPNNPERPLRAFVMLHEEYNILEFLLKYCKD